MHSSLFLAGFGALFTAVTAGPIKREMIIETTTQVDVVTDYITETVWVDAPTGPLDYFQAKHTYGAEHHPVPVVTTSIYIAPVPTTTSTTSKTSTSIVQVVPQAYTAPAPVAPVPTTTSTSVYIAPPPPTTTSVYVAPAPTTTSTSEYVAPTPVYTPPAYTPPAYTPPAYTPPAATTTTPAPAATTAASSSGGSGQYSGDITYYDVGLGSCGYTNTDSEMVVAMAHGMMDKATMCGKTVTLYYNGVSQQAKVVDTCMSCVNGDLDLSPTLFKAIAPNGDGRVHGVSWSFT